VSPGWRVAGTYFESCNCDAICPCRRTDGAEGGRSTLPVDEAAFQWCFSGVCGFTTTFDYSSDS